MTKSHFNALSGGTALWVLLSGAASADVTALEVWDNWKSYSESFGQTITVGSQDTNGGTLTLHDVSMSMEFPDGKMSGTVEMIALREIGDGTVEITMSPDYPMAVSIDPQEGEEVDLTMIFRQTGLAMIASGDDTNVGYDLKAEEMNVAIDKFIVDGEDIEADIQLAMNDITGVYSIAEGDNRQITSDLNAANATMIFRITDPDDGTKVDLKGTMEDMASQSSVTLPPEIDMEDPSWVFGSDFNATGNFVGGATTMELNAEDEDGPLTINSSSQSSTLNFGIVDGTISYGGSSKGAEYKVSGAMIPLPEVTMSIAEAAFNLVMPMKKSDEPNEFGFLTKLVGLNISDDIWGMFDPAQNLPRDPATLIIDVAGKMNWLIDVSDPEAAEAFTEQDKAPVELHDLTINDITLALAGAVVTSTGNFTFDNSDLKTFDGLPAPTGAINMNIVGVNGLIDSLITMGMLPQEQAMGARMMLGLFASPGEGEDTLTSTIEVKGDGSVFANGQQLK